MIPFQKFKLSMEDYLRLILILQTTDVFTLQPRVEKMSLGPNYIVNWLVAVPVTWILVKISTLSKDRFVTHVIRQTLNEIIQHLMPLMALPIGGRAHLCLEG